MNIGDTYTRKSSCSYKLDEYLRIVAARLFGGSTWYICEAVDGYQVMVVYALHAFETWTPCTVEQFNAAVEAATAKQTAERVAAEKRRKTEERKAAALAKLKDDAPRYGVHVKVTDYRRGPSEAVTIVRTTSRSYVAFDGRKYKRSNGYGDVGWIDNDGLIALRELVGSRDIVDIVAERRKQAEEKTP